MGNKIVLVSDDSDFFSYISTKLELRKSDELFEFSFDDIPDRIKFLQSAVIIVNSESSNEKTLDFLNLFNGTPIIVSAYNDDDTYRRKCFRAGAFDFITLLIPDSEFRARMIPALTVSSILEKNSQYRDVLVRNEILASENEVFIDYNYILDKNLEIINSANIKAVFAAISPSDKTKFLLKPLVIESIILNNIRKNDILMNYAPNKYFLLMFNSDLNSAQKVWQKIVHQMPEKIYAGFTNVFNQKRQQLINEALNKLHEAISSDKYIVNTDSSPVDVLNTLQGTSSAYSNFKLFKQEFGRKILQIISPVFYQVQQKYEGKLPGVLIEQISGEGFGTFNLKGKYSTASFRLTSPGFSKITIDITSQKDSNTVDAKRISLEPDELEKGLLEDLLEQFISEYRRSLGNDS